MSHARALATPEGRRFRPRALQLLNRLVSRAHALAMTDYPRAARHARTAALLTARLASRCAFVPPEFVSLRAEALRESADTLARCSRFAAAERAGWQARRLFARCEGSDTVRSSARTDLTLGWLRFFGGHTDEGLGLIRGGGEVLLRDCGDVAGWAKARITEAGMLARIHRHVEALDILLATLGTRDVESALDEKTIAAMSNNAAISAVELDHPRAEELCLEALRRLEAAGMWMDRLRAQTLIAKLYRKRGRVDEALAEYERTRRELAARRLEGWAASVGATIAQIHAEQGRIAEAERIAREILPTLDDVNFALEAAEVRELLARCAPR